MRDTLIGAGLVCAVLGLGGAAVIGLAMVLCTVNLSPIPPGALTSIVRLMTLGCFGLLASTLALRRHFSV